MHELCFSGAAIKPFYGYKDLGIGQVSNVIIFFCANGSSELGTRALEPMAGRLN